ncbi:MAG: GGDEF domain-containing protein [Sulfurimonas sp.]|uniref:GGDEF domain-containing protein n=1 Tax=Sulfurimonas sp. TaxID=2022749 RepID=UPI00261DEFE9|nr:GGDEF domain-containing protein [Sulfurimonas sp.]MCW8896307.1 GGDEF domain-containing protein [Sulfurimonas sp.]MCW8954736.1 GGDEF domain-containing protein [Sulfurimonas sp.]MCW9068386.1 GGDEF domain-containing protein [Sulfurimonas sp.]
MNSLKLISINIGIPLFIYLVFALLTFNSAKLPNFLFIIVPYLFYALSIMIIWVSWHFNRNRFIFVITPLILIHLGFDYLSAAKATLLFHYASIIYPLHLLIFLVLKERGLFSVWGILKIAFVVFETAVVLYLLYYPSEQVQNFLNLKIFAISFYPLKDIAIAVFLFIFFVMSALILFNRYLIYNSTFLMILISYISGFYFLKMSYAVDMAFLTIAMIIFILLIRETYRLAFYDELTSMPGRRALVEDMAKLGRKYSLAMIDIDHFKKFNDTYGHDTGDEVLKMVASKLSAVGGGGKAYRYGGEEFTILFASKDADECFGYVDILRQNIATTPFVVRNRKKSKTIYVNISAGLVQNGSKDKEPFAVMKRADNALYKAKEAGRNKVIKA